MRSRKLSNKPKNLGPMRSPLQKVTAGIKTMMAPSSSHLQAAASPASSSVAGVSGNLKHPQEHPLEPSLYQIPVDLYPEYRPLPTSANVVIVSASILSSAMSTWKRATWLHPLAIVRGLKRIPSLGETISFVLKSLLLATFAKVVLQDLFFPPSRISIDAMKEKYFLPSSLSKYEVLNVSGVCGNGSAVGVHYLKCAGNATDTGPFDAVYAHHGFGASSLSWLPTLPALVGRLGAQVGLGHDMVGFGFTERQEHLDWYTTDASARISRAVLQTEGPKLSSKPVALFGHSLGSLGVLKMALQLPKETPKFIVLCAPAFGLTSKFAPESSNAGSASKGAGLFQRANQGVQKRLVYPVGGYVLRRLVGMKDSWKLGLKAAAWGNPKMVTESDVLRYQWPAIGRGWETGLLNFARAQRRVDDRTLLKNVLDLPNTTVAVVLGAKDKVVPAKAIRTFLEDFEGYDIPIVEMPGMGHDAFEEDVEGFVRCVEELLESQKWTNA